MTELLKNLTTDATVLLERLTARVAGRDEGQWPEESLTTHSDVAHYRESDGAGGELNVYFPLTDGLPTGEFLITAFDHESEFNFLGSDSSMEELIQAQVSLFKGMPESLQGFLTDERFFWPWYEDQVMLMASQVVWITKGWPHANLVAYIGSELEGEGLFMGWTVQENQEKDF